VTTPSAPVTHPRSWLRIGLAAVLLACAGALYFGHFHILPAGYSTQIYFAAHTHFRESLIAPWAASEMRPRRVDQTVSATPKVSLVQSSVQWTTPAGEVNYESAGLYGVNRETRTNVGDYGNRKRTGQFLFPIHTQPQKYELWDPYYTGPRQCLFIREEMKAGLKVFLFTCDAEDIEDTAGYTALPDVPEVFDANSDGSGYVWVEPISGVIVDFLDYGKSYFVDRESREPKGDFYWWTAWYSPETAAAQLKLAQEARRRILLKERWLPIGLALAAVLALIFPAAAWRPPRR
jgi:hypothetical protein